MFAQAVLPNMAAVFPQIHDTVDYFLPVASELLWKIIIFGKHIVKNIICTALFMTVQFCKSSAS